MPATTIPGTIRTLRPGPAATAIRCECGGEAGALPSGTIVATRGAKATREHVASCRSCGRTFTVPLVNVGQG